MFYDSIIHGFGFRINRKIKKCMLSCWWTVKFSMLTMKEVQVNQQGEWIFWSWLLLQVCLVNDPRNPYNKLLTVEYLSNMTNGRLVLYNNQPVEVLKRLAAASLKDNEVQNDWTLALSQETSWGLRQCEHKLLVGPSGRWLGVGPPTPPSFSVTETTMMLRVLLQPCSTKIHLHTPPSTQVLLLPTILANTKTTF